MADTKRCSGPCGQDLPESEFQARQSKCRQCRKDADVERRRPRNNVELISDLRDDLLDEGIPAAEVASSVAVMGAQVPGSQVPFMITKAMRRRLRELDISDEDVAEMTPEMAWQVIQEREAKPDDRWPNLRKFETEVDDDLANYAAGVDAQFDSSDVVEDEEETAAERRERKAREKAEKESQARARRLQSDFAPVQAEDFDDDDMDPAEFSSEFGTAISNSYNKTVSNKGAAKEKRQEFNEKMGEFAMSLRDSATRAHENGGVGLGLPEQHASYIRKLAEQERRFGNRRWARSIAIAEAHEQLAREAYIHVAQKYFADKITPTGFATKPKQKDAKRTVCLLLSDLHLGSELDSMDEPFSFLAIQEARRLEFVLRQVIDFKPQYRDQSEALIIINGDIIEGQLMHDFRSGSPLAEQKAIFWSYFRTFIGYVARCYPSVRIVCQPGNHGRDKVRHPGRATARKWDGHEWEMYYALQQMCSGLANVTWSIPFRAVSIVDLYGSKLGVTHADTEVKLGDPDTKSTDNARILDRINSTNIYGCQFDAWCFGHFHKARYQPRNPKVIWNAALVPPNGHARSSGYIGEPQGQFLWEAVEGYPVGDLRFIEVNERHDTDESLGTVIKPFRFRDTD